VRPTTLQVLVATVATIVLLLIVWAVAGHLGVANHCDPAALSCGR
jgi:hypothetical protein